MARKKRSTKDLAEPITPENFTETMQFLYPDDLLKEVYWTGQPVEQTLYRWFYEYVRAGREIGSIRDELAGHPAKAQAMAETDRLWGDLGVDFDNWWGDGGQQLFTEREVPRVEVLHRELQHYRTHSDAALLVSIPLHLSRDILLEQLNFVLAAYHPGDALRRHAYSTAAIKLFPRERYPATDYEFLLKTWRAARPLKEADMPINWWLIYCDAMGMDQKSIGQLQSGHMYDEVTRDRMIRSAKKFYKQAEQLVYNAAIGQFPCDKKLTPMTDSSGELTWITLS